MKMKCLKIEMIQGGARECVDSDYNINEMNENDDLANVGYNKRKEHK